MEGNITVTKLLTEYIKHGQTEDTRKGYRVLYAFGLISPEAHGKLVSLMDKLNYIKSIEESGQSSFARRAMNLIWTMDEAQKFDEGEC